MTFLPVSQSEHTLEETRLLKKTRMWFKYLILNVMPQRNVAVYLHSGHMGKAEKTVPNVTWLRQEPVHLTRSRQMANVPQVWKFWLRLHHVYFR